MMLRMGGRLLLAFVSGCGALMLLQSSQRVAAQTPAAQSDTTPKGADGHPDLNGYWGQQGFNPFAGPPDIKFNGKMVIPLRNGDISNFTNDAVIARRASDNLPLYKPAYWAKVQELDHAGNKLDPFSRCMPLTPPRIGPPAEIVVLPQQVILIYKVIFQRNDFRLVPFAPRTHPLDPDGTWTGDPVAHWDGDTLVVVTEGFTDDTWLGPEGYLHGFNLKTTERFRRVGDNLIYDVTVEDPDYLQKPWVLPTKQIPRITQPGFTLDDSPPCSDRDVDHEVGTQREM
jgi:hypothetical protein